MGYVEKSLASGERIVFRTFLHKIIFFPSFIWFFSAMALSFLGMKLDLVYLSYAGLAALIPAFLKAISALVRFWTSEFAVTNRRILMKTGVWSVHSLDLVVSKVESLRVDQSFLGSLLNYGTLTITGTGGTHDVFPMIASPLLFRKSIDEQSQPA